MISTSKISTQDKNDNSQVDTYFGYVRISWWKEQKNRNLSIPSQIEQIKNYEKQKSDIIVTKMYEEVHSAFKWGNRPVFNALLKELKKRNDIKGIIVFKRDRISRNPDDYIRLQKIRWDKNPIEIISISEPMINSYLGRYMIRDLQNRSILYSEELSFRVKLWHRKKLQMWGYPYNAPFGYNIHKWYLSPNPETSEMVRFIFNTYATWQFWLRKLAGIVREKYWMKKFTKGYLEHIMYNTIYYWICTKKWMLGTEEYAFFGAEKPWEFVELYPIKTIEPLITQELFEECKEIARLRSPYNWVRSWVAKFPKVFQCVCWRNLKRYDQKWNRYLACIKHINYKFPNRCHERHTNLNLIDKQVEKIVRWWIPKEDEREAILQQVKQWEKDAGQARTQQLSQTLVDIAKLQDKQEEMTTSYATDAISKQVYQKTSEHIQQEITAKNKTIHQLEKEDVYNKAMQKMRSFIQMLGKRDSMLDNSDLTKKSSQLYSILLKGVVNSLIGGRKVLSHKALQPFSLLEVLSIGGIQAQRELNPLRAALETAALPMSYGPKAIVT